MPALPGLLAMTPPRKTARGRENDRLIVYLVLTGQATVSTAEYLQLTSQTASRFFETPGAITSAMRAAVESLNRIMLERNLASSGRGQYAAGWLVLAVIRSGNCTFLQSGLSHVFLMARDGLRRWHDPALSGKGLGLSQTAAYHLSQVELQIGDRLLFSAKPPGAWEQTLSDDDGSISLEALRRRLISQAQGDMNAILIQAHEGTGNLVVQRPVPAEGNPSKDLPLATVSSKPGTAPPSHKPYPASDVVESVRQDGVTGQQNIPPHQSTLETVEPPSLPLQPVDLDGDDAGVEPSAYAIPPQQKEEQYLPGNELGAPQFPASIPRARPPVTEETPSTLQEMEEPIMSEAQQSKEPRQPPRVARQTAVVLVGGIRTGRRLSDAISKNLQKFLPNLLPGESSPAASLNYLMVLISVVIPLMIVAIGSTVYLRYGRSYQYDHYFLQAQAAREQAVSAADPVRQRDDWRLVLFFINKAETYRDLSTETKALREEAQTKLDELEGIQRLEFYSALGKGVNGKISRMAANETDLYLLDAERGRVLRITQNGQELQLDEAFRCEPGVYGDYQVSPLVDILILPRLNSLNASVLGVDAGGNLLYCAPGQVPQAIPLPIPDTNWGRVTTFTLDSGNLYVLDASLRAIWVYTGKDASFVDRPYFFFGGQIPQIEDSIDMVVNGDELYLLHADGRLSTCSYSRLDTAPTRCVDPAKLVNTFPAYQDLDVFSQAHFTQMQLAALPDLSILLLDADTQGIFRISSRSLELQTQIRPMPGQNNPLPGGSASAMTVNPNGVLFLAIEEWVYFATNVP